MKNFLSDILGFTISIFILLPILYFGSAFVIFFFLGSSCDNIHSTFDCGPAIFLGALAITLLIFVIAYIIHRKKNSLQSPTLPTPINSPFRGIGYLIWGIIGAPAVTVVFYVVLEISTAKDQITGISHQPSWWEAVPAGILVFAYFVTQWYKKSRS